MSVESPRRFKARYASSMAGEIKKNVVLASGETIVDSRLVRQRKNWLIARPRLLAVTPLQLILVEHNMLTADWIVQIPRSAITQVSCEETAMSAWVKFTYLDSAESRTVWIQPMTRRPSKRQNQELFELLNSFHQGRLDTRAAELATAPA